MLGQQVKYVALLSPFSTSLILWTRSRLVSFGEQLQVVYYPFEVLSLLQVWR